MSKQERPSSNLLHRRLALVAELAGLHAELLKLTQALAGTEMEVLRLELEAEATGAEQQLVQNLHDEQERASAMSARLRTCEEHIANAEEAMAEIDRLLEETAGD
jgi:chromosome segregation ATPase